MGFTPDREQAGSQPGRGCIEHIVTLRLIMDTCLRRKLPLYIVYSPDKSRADISPRLFQGYWATAYLPVAYC